MASLPPSQFAEALRKFEEVAPKSPDVAIEFNHLVQVATRLNIKVRKHLSADGLRYFALSTATFGRTRPIVEDIAKSPWALDAAAILENFGSTSLLSLDFVKKLRWYARLGRDSSCSWDAAKAALDKARSARLQTSARGVPKRDWTTTDISQAAGQLSIADHEENAGPRQPESMAEKKVGSRPSRQDTSTATATQTVSPAPSATPPAAVPSTDQNGLKKTTDNVQHTRTDVDDEHGDANHGHRQVDAVRDGDNGGANHTQLEAGAVTDDDESDGGDYGNDEFEGISSDDSNDSDGGQGNGQMDSDDVPGIEMARRDDSVRASQPSPLSDFNSDLEDYSFADADPSPASPIRLAAPGLYSPLPNLQERDEATIQHVRGRTSTTPRKRQHTHSESEPYSPPLKHRRTIWGLKSTHAQSKARRARLLPESYANMLSPLVEGVDYRPYARRPLDARGETGEQGDRLRGALSDGHVSVRRSRRSLSLPAPDTKRSGNGHEVADGPEAQQQADSNPHKSRDPSKDSSHPSPDMVHIDDDPDPAATAVDAPQPPPQATQILNQLRPFEWLGHISIWGIVELFLPPSQVRIIDVAGPKASETWDAWASHSRLHRLESDAMLLVPLYVSRQQHWVLMCLDLELHRASLFNSISDEATARDLGVAARAVVTALNLSWAGGEWSYQSDPKALQQTNDHDCGIYVIVTCVYLLARTDLPSEIDASCWRVTFTRALLDPQPDDQGSEGLFTSLKVPDASPDAQHQPRGARGLVKAAQTLRDRSKILAKAAMRAEEMVRVIQLARMRLCGYKSNLDEARRDVSIREQLVRDVANLPRSHASDVQMLHQLKNTLRHAQAQLSKEEAVVQRLCTNTTILKTLCQWLDKQRLELRQLREQADRNEALAMAAVREECKILKEFLQ